MPIVGLTDQKRPSFPKIGDIRKGAEKGKNQPGKDLTYFRYVPIEGEEEAAQAFGARYRDQPREVLFSHRNLGSLCLLVALLPLDKKLSDPK